MDTDSFIVCIKTNDIYKGIAQVIETRFDNSNYDLNRPFPKEKNKKVIGIMKDELGRKVMKKFLRLRSRIYSYLIDDSSEKKREKISKSCVIKRKLKLKDYKNCLERTQVENKLNHIEKNEIQVDSLKKDYKEFMKNRNIMLGTQQNLKVKGTMFTLKKYIRFLWVQMMIK